MTTRILIGPDELAELTAHEHVVVIDTRDPDSYAAGHIPGAVNVHEVFTYLATSTPEGIAALRATFADAFGRAGVSGRETVVVCEQSMTGGFGQSCRGFLLLTSLDLEAHYPNTFVWGAGDLSEINTGFVRVEVKVAVEADASAEALDDLVAHAVAWSPIAGTLRNPVALDVVRAPRPAAA